MRLISVQKRPDKHLMYHVQQETEGKDFESQARDYPETRSLEKPDENAATEANVQTFQSLAHTCEPDRPWPRSHCTHVRGREHQLMLYRGGAEPSRETCPPSTLRSTKPQQTLRFEPHHLGARSCSVVAYHANKLRLQKRSLSPPPFFDCSSHESLGQKFPACSMHAQAGVRRRFCILNRV